MGNEDKTHEDYFQDEPDIDKVEEEIITGDVDQETQDGHKVGDDVLDEEGDGENCGENDRGVEGDANSVEISIGRSGLRRTRKPPSEHLNSFAKEFQYPSVH